MARWTEQKINNKAWNTHRPKENATSATCVKKLQKLPSKVKGKKAGPRTCKGGTSKKIRNNVRNTQKPNENATSATCRRKLQKLPSN